MADYNVKEVSKILNTSEETVRRWVRAGKLFATNSSKKEGFKITSDALNQFVKDTPKYASLFAANLALPTIGLSLAVGGLINTIINPKKVSPERVKEYLKEEISKTMKAVEHKEKTIEQLQVELDNEKKKLEQYTYAIDHLDLEEIANEINGRE